MILKLSWRRFSVLLTAALVATAPGMASAAFKATLQGQSAGSTNWISQNLMGWRELDYIPCRVLMSGGPANNKTIVIDFDHMMGTTPGVENLTGFVYSPNVTVVSGPTLNAPPLGNKWGYTLVVNVANNQPATIEFRARLSAGSHLNSGSSLALGGSPSLGTLQIHKPDAAPGIPDLVINKSGPATAAPGEVITYTINYFNKTNAGNTATGVQITDVLTNLVTYVSNSITGGGVLLGKGTLIWDVGTLVPGQSGSLTYQAQVNADVPFGTTFNNYARILSAENDADYADNVSVVTTTVAFNRPPVATNDAFTINEDTLLSVTAPGILANDADADGDSLRAILVSGPTNGALVLNTNGSFTYRPNTNFFGSDSFTYKANDRALDSAPATVTITVLPVNDPPVAVNDAFTVNEDTLLTVAAPGILANDSDVEGATLGAILLAGPAHGTLSLNANGSFSYQPATNYHGPDAFTYKANDGAFDSAPATVAITVLPVNDPPIAVNDAYTTAEDTLLTVAAPGILANDSDVEGAVLSAVLVTGPAHGAITLNANGSFTYLPATNYHGPDSFAYKANDGAADSGVTIVSITVTPVNDVPVAVNDAYTTPEDTLLTVVLPGVLANDSDGDGDALTAALISNPASGVLGLNADGSFTYQPNSNFHGTDTFTYRASDGVTNSAATVTITVTPVNDVPIAANDAYTTPEDTLLTVTVPGVLANDTDADGTALTTVLVTGPANGALSLNADGSFTYLPNTNYHGSDSFTYRASDGVTNSGIATVTLTVIPGNDTPVAMNDGYVTAEDTMLAVALPGVLSNDSDMDGDALTAVLAIGPTHGTLTLNADGSFSYQPATNYHGPDSFTYRASDGTNLSAVATVSILVTPVNDAPVAVNDSHSTAEDTQLVVAAPGILGNDSDADGDALTAALVTGPAHGSLSLNANGSFTYTPATNYHGPDAFTYKANDGTTDSGLATVTITVTPLNDAPVAANDAFTTTEDTLLTVTLPGVLVNDTDADGDALTAILVTGPTNGVLSLNPNGSFTYQPGTNFHGADSFTYRANDGAADSGIATVAITVTSVNDAPVAQSDSFTTAEDTLLVIATPGILTNDSDADGDALSAVLVTTTTNGVLTLGTNGSFNYLPASNLHGVDIFTYRANDGTADSGIATVTITVTSVNDAPVAANDSYTTAEDTLLTVTLPGVLANDSDNDGDALSAVLASNPANGALVLNVNGSFTYQPNSNFHGTDSFTYKANDGVADSGIATVAITVTPVNDLPIAVNESYGLFEDTALIVPVPGVLANDSDVEGALTAAVVTGPAHGSLTLNGDGSFTYTPATNYNGPDSFVYRANDGSTNESNATVSLTVGPVNDAPSFTAGPDQTVPENSVPLLIPGWATSRSPGPANEAGQALAFAVSNDAPQLFIGQPSINPQGDLFFVPAPGAFGTANVTVTLQDDGGTANGGVDTSASITFHITINTPPVVSIVNPTNGSVFLAPASFPLTASATDADGTVASVELFLGTNSLGVFTNPPYQVPMNNLPVGTYTFTAHATDNRGAVGNATPVTVSVVSAPPVVTLGTLLNPQVNLFELSVRVDNPTPLVFSAVRVVISNLPPGTIVANASGTNAAGLPFVQYNQPVAPGGSAPMVIEYMTPNRQPASPVLTVEIVAPMPPPAPATGTFVPVTRLGQLSGGRIFIGFETIAGRNYFIEYSDDLVAWKTAATGVYAYVNFAQWTDNGAPKTVSHPATVEKRFYRVRLAP